MAMDEGMKVKVLGTAAAEAWPGLFCTCEACKEARRRGGKNIRTRSSMLFDDALMIDFSADTYLHVLRDNLDLSVLKYLFVTHSHSDHFYPHDLFMRMPPFAHLDTPALTVYGNDCVLARVAKAYGEERYDEEKLEQWLRFHELKMFEPVQAGPYLVTPYRALHDRKEDCMFFSVEKGGKTMLYGHDTGHFPEDSWAAMKGKHFDLILLDCTVGPNTDGKNHMGLPDNALMRERFLKEGLADETTRFVVTHFSHNGAVLHEEMVEMAGALGFETAYDGVEYDL